MHTTKQSGFTLIEVLVSVFVLALGVIGVAGMQLTAMRNSQVSSYQTVAVQLAAELADKMRSNAVEMKKADDSNAFIFTYNSAADGDPTAGTKCFATACTAEQMADFDVYEWKQRLITLLPGGRVAICRDTTPVDSGALRWACTSSLTGQGDAPLVIKVGWLGRGKNPDGSENTSGAYPPSVAIAVESYVKAEQLVE